MASARRRRPPNVRAGGFGAALRVTRRRTGPILLAGGIVLGCSETSTTGPEPEPIEHLPIAELLVDTITVVTNPSGRTPLAGELRFSTREAVRSTLRLLGEGAFLQEFAGPATEHVLPVIGLLPATENLLEVELTRSDGRSAVDTVRVQAPDLPTFLPDVVITVADTARMEPGWTLASLSVGLGGEFDTVPILFDTGGRIRWFLDLSDGEDMGFAIEPLANGNLLIGQGRAIFEFDWLGNQINRWPMPGYWYHHDVVEQADGNLLVAVIKLSIATIEDHVIELDRASGAIVNEWDLRTVLDVSRQVAGGTDTDWFHMNAIWVDPADDGLILSGQRQGVVKIDREGALEWILAPHLGWGPAGVDGAGHETSEFLLTAVDASGTPYPQDVQDGVQSASDFDWPWGQHAPLVLPTGTLLVFDNGLGRQYGEGEDYSRAVEYAIDPEARTVRQVWQYGEERGAEYYAPIISDVDHLPATGNRLVMPGIVFGAAPLAFVSEVTPAGDLVFEAEIRFRNERAPGAFGWGDTDLVYRSERVWPYPQSN